MSRSSSLAITKPSGISLLDFIKIKKISNLPGIVSSREKMSNIKKCRFIEDIAPECHDGWEIMEMDNGTRFFVHRKYPGENFNIGCIQKYDDVHNVICKYMYPLMDPKNDKYNLGFCFTHTHMGDVTVVPNNMQVFWDTRRGKRYSNYIKYRKLRDVRKKEFMISEKK